MTSEELRAFCSKQNLTYKELAEKIGYSESAIKNAANGIVK
ncbi:helix-turn-helix domain-containing protein [Campylobacter curvus]|nr:helix-turn-helix transcriptional regulator [Campylobacter curvus]